MLPRRVLACCYGAPPLLPPRRLFDMIFAMPCLFFATMMPPDAAMIFFFFFFFFFLLMPDIYAATLPFYHHACSPATRHCRHYLMPPHAEASVFLQEFHARYDDVLRARYAILRKDFRASDVAMRGA